MLSCFSLSLHSASLFLSLTASFIAVNPAINIVGLLNMRLVFCFSLDIMHCFKSESESLLGIKSKLRHWELSYWEWPCRRGCLRAEQFPWIFHCQPSGCCVARTRGVPGVKGKWIPTYPASERVWALHSVCLLDQFQQTHRLTHSRACLWSRWSLLPFSSHPFADFTEVWLTLDSTSVDVTLKRAWGETFAQYVIKTVALYHHPTPVLITLLDNVPVSVTTISASSEDSRFLGPSDSVTVNKDKKVKGLYFLHKLLFFVSLTL